MVPTTPTANTMIEIRVPQRWMATAILTALLGFLKNAPQQATITPAIVVIASKQNATIRSDGNSPMKCIV